MADELPDWAKPVAKDKVPVDPDLPDWARAAPPVADPPSELVGAEATTFEQFLTGLGDVPRGLMEIAGQTGLLPERPAAAGVPAGATAATKVPGQPPPALSAARIAGNIAQPLNWVPPLAAARVAPAVGPLARAAIAGGVGGLMQPTEDKTRPFLPQKAEQAAGGVALGFGFSVAGKGVSKSVEMLGNYLLSRYPEALNNTAVATVLRRIAQDEKAGGATAQHMIDLIDAANQAGKPMTLADVGGRNVRGLAGGVFRSGGEAAAIPEVLFKQRDPGAMDRLTGDVQLYVHGGPSSFEATQALLQARSTRARPLYEQTDRLQNIWSPRLQRFIEDPDVRRGMARGYVIERRNALAENRPFDPTMLGVDLDADGNIVYLRTPNMRVLDMGKQGLDAMIADERDELTGRLSAGGVALEKVRRAYLGELDSLDTSGVYRRAREAWAGPSASLDALRMGRNSFNNSPEVNASEFGALAANNQEFYRMGVADVLKEKLAKTGLSADESKSILRNEWMRRQMRPAFRSQEDFDGFMTAVEREQQMFGAMRAIGGGSQTAERVSEDVRNDRLFAAAKIGKQALGGHYLAAVRDFIRLHRDLGLVPDEKLNVAISKILFSPLSPENQTARSILFKPPVIPRPTETAERAITDIAAPIGAAGVGGELVRRFDAQGNPEP